MNVSKKAIVKSMTGFGRGNFKGEICSAYVEIKTVNHRYLEVNTKLPDEFTALDMEIKKIIKQYVKRGSVYLNLNFVYEEGVDLKINERLFHKLLKLEEELTKKHGIKQPLNIHYILSYPGVIKQARPQVSYRIKREAMIKALKDALESLVKSRVKEGGNLQKDIEDCLQKIAKNLQTIAQTEKSKEAILAKRLQAEAKSNMLAQAQPPLPSTSEEIVRLKSHIKAVNDLLHRKGVIGRELDFMAQEMNREANTISSKAMSSKTARFVVRVKADIEKIREQALNIE